MTVETNQLEQALFNATQDCVRLAKVIEDHVSYSPAEQTVLKKFYVGDIQNSVGRLPNFEQTDNQDGYRELIHNLPVIEQSVRDGNSENLRKIARQIKAVNA